MKENSIHGLTTEEAAKLREAGRGNQQPKSKDGGVGEILRRNVLTLFNLLNVILALLLLGTGSYRNMLSSWAWSSPTLLSAPFRSFGPSAPTTGCSF